MQDIASSDSKRMLMRISGIISISYLQHREGLGKRPRLCFELHGSLCFPLRPGESPRGQRGKEYCLHSLSRGTGIVTEAILEGRGHRSL